MKGAKDMRPRRKDERRPTAVSRDSFAEVLPGDCHPMYCSQLTVWLEVPWEQCKEWHVPLGVMGALAYRTCCGSYRQSFSGSGRLSRMASIRAMTPSSS